MIYLFTNTEGAASGAGIGTDDRREKALLQPDPVEILELYDLRRTPPSYHQCIHRRSNPSYESFELFIIMHLT